MMDTPGGDEKVTRQPRQQQPAMMIRFGRFALKGTTAGVVLVVLLLLIAALVIYSRPTVRMLLSAGLWILFIVYWSSAARNAAPAKSSESQESRRLHTHLLNAALLLLFIPVPGLRWRYLPLSLSIVAAGLTLQASSALLAVWARRHLGRNWAGAISIKVDHQLVRSGPYRLVRHPIYTAMIGMFIGAAIVSGELHALVALALIAVAYWRKIRLEERTLLEAFGPAYDEYRRGRRAVIPWLLTL